MSEHVTANATPVASPVVPVILTSLSAPVFKCVDSDARLATWNQAPNASPVLAPSTFVSVAVSS